MNPSPSAANLLPLDSSDDVLIDASAQLVFPAGPWTLNLADTLTNFSDGTLEDSQP